MNVNFTNPFLGFSQDVLNCIFSYVSTSDLTQRVVLVCKLFREIAKQEIQWKERAIRFLGKEQADQLFSEVKDWKIAYILGPNGKVDKGDIKRGDFEGKRVHPNGNIDEGIFQHYIIIEGKRTCSGIIYKGMFKDQKLNGKGTKTNAKGTVYEGEFIDNKLNGKGKIIHYPSGTIEEGEFKDDELNGNRKVTLSNGTIKEGEFKDGLLHGKGKLTFPDETIVKGEFNNGVLSKGEVILPDGTIKEGEFKDGLLHGKGKLTVPDGAIVEGEFKDDELNGQGKITHSNGAIEEGEFKDGALNKGKVTYSDGPIKAMEQLLILRDQLKKVNSKMEC